MFKESFSFQLVLLVCIISTFVVDGYKILLFAPAHSNSNLFLYYRLGDLLGSHGHQVVVHVPRATKHLDTTTKPKYATAWHYVVDAERDTSNDNSGAIFEDMHVFKAIPLFLRFFELLEQDCRKQISDRDLMDRFRNEKFDLAVAHMYDPCPLGIIQALGIPSHIWMSSSVLMDYMAWNIGVPSPPSFVPNVMSSFGDRMTLWERIQNAFGLSVFHLVYHHYMMEPFTKLFREHFGPDFPHMEQLASQVPLVFVNSNELTDFPRPILHKVIYMGGIDDGGKAKQLKAEWSGIVERPGQAGVVLFSFGSVTRAEQMPASWRLSFLEAFSRLPNYTFIWKYEGEFPEADNVKNVKLTPWAPQKDLLAHPKTKAFITHCGQNSFTEFTKFGVPVLALPLFGDQKGNAKRAERHGIAIGLEKTGISADVVYEKLKALLTDPKYSENAKLLASMIKKKPVKPEQLAVGWVEFLAEHKRLPNLQPASSDMGFLEYFMIDVALAFLLGSILFLFIVWVAGNFVIRRCYSFTKSDSSIKNKAE